MRKRVLWGQNVDEYREMFNLSAVDLQGKLLEYGCGPSTVNSELNQKAQSIVSCDPLFSLDKAVLQSKVDLIFEDRVQQMTKNQEKFNFSHYKNLEGLVAKRREGIVRFFADYEQGKIEQRYISVNEERLPFRDFSFDLALSAHYFFTDLPEQDVTVHLNMIKELTRVAKEIRIFPLIDCHGQPSTLLGPVLLGLQQENLGMEVKEVTYPLQSNENAMLRVWAQTCQI